MAEWLLLGLRGRTTTIVYVLHLYYIRRRPSGQDRRRSCAMLEAEEVRGTDALLPALLDLILKVIVKRD